MRKMIFCWSLCILAAVCVLACTPPGAPEPTHYRITGHVYDGMNGDPVSNATFRYGGSSDTTGSDGAFSIDLGASAGIFDEPMGFSAAGYTFMYFDPVRVDTTDTNELVLRLKPLTEVLYSVKDVHCTVYETDGTTEITDATRVLLVVLPMNGIYGAAQSTSYDAGGYYDLAVNRHSADCLVLIWVTRPDPTQSFCAHLTGVDLSGSEPIDLRFDEPTSGTSDVALTADTTFSRATGEFVTPYGLLPIVCTYTDDGGPQTLMDTTVEFSDGTTETVTVYNPDGWPCFWMQSGIGAVIGSSARTLLSTTAIGAMTSPVTLPTLSAGLGPSSEPVMDSWAYDPVAGSISIDPILDAQLLQFVVLNTDPIVYQVGTIVSFGNPVVLPTWVNDLVSNDSPRTMMMMPMDTDLAAYELDMVNRDTYPASAHFGVLVLDGSYAPFSKEFAF